LDLSESECRRLTEIGDDLWRDDPCLARLLSGSVGRRRLLRSAAFGLAMVGVAMEVGGAFARQPLICALAWLGMIIGVSVILLTPGRPRRLRGWRG
jgi:hypothetical protein